MDLLFSECVQIKGFPGTIRDSLGRNTEGGRIKHGRSRDYQICERMGSRQLCKHSSIDIKIMLSVKQKNWHKYI